MIYPHPPVSKKEAAEKDFVQMVKAYDVQLIAIGNGTASRETEQFVADLIKKHQLPVQFIIVNEFNLTFNTSLPKSLPPNPSLSNN